MLRKLILSVVDTGFPMDIRRIPPHVRVALLYLVAASLWIIISDRAVALYTDDPTLVTRLSIYKGLAFIAITAFLLFLERKRSDAQMRHLAAIVESSEDAIIGIDSHTKITSWNRGAERIYGLQKAEILGQPIATLVPSERSGELRDITERVMRGEHIDHYESFSQRKDGSLVDLSIGVSPIHDEKGRFIGSSIIARDITERKRNEERARIQQMELLQASKMASIGVLATGMAHEINNPNNYVLLNARIISHAWNDVKPILEAYQRQNGDFSVAGLPYSTAYSKIDQLVSGVAEGAQRIQRIVNGLKEFSRQDTGDLSQDVDLASIIHSAIDIVRSLIKQSTDFFAVESEGNVPHVSGNAQQLEQVVINLLTNACHALRSKEDRITLNLQAVDDSGKVMIRVMDTGIGIPPEHIGSIMDPFFTTKRERGGTGLGLSISYNIVKNHGGELKFDSAPGEGTTATVLLPAHRTLAS